MSSATYAKGAICDRGPAAGHWRPRISPEARPGRGPAAGRAQADRNEQQREAPPGQTPGAHLRDDEARSRQQRTADDDTDRTREHHSQPADGNEQDRTHPNTPPFLVWVWVWIWVFLVWSLEIHLFGAGGRSMCGRDARHSGRSRQGAIFWGSRSLGGLWKTGRALIEGSKLCTRCLVTRATLTVFHSPLWGRIVGNRPYLDRREQALHQAPRDASHPHGFPQSGSGVGLWETGRAVIEESRLCTRRLVAQSHPLGFPQPDLRFRLCVWGCISGSEIPWPPLQ